MWPAGKSFPRQLAGRPIAARTLNGPIAEAERLSRRRVGSGLASASAAGVPLERVPREEALWARLVAGGGNGVYGWQGVYRDPANPANWLDLETQVSGTATGPDPAIEANGNSGLVADPKKGVIVRISRERATGLWMFQFDQCSTGNSP